jgi:hypothetical protein
MLDQHDDSELIPADLLDLASRINQEHRGVGESLQAGLQHAKQAGELLDRHEGREAERKQREDAHAEKTTIF